MRRGHWIGLIVALLLVAGIVLAAVSIVLDCREIPEQRMKMLMRTHRDGTGAIHTEPFTIIFDGGMVRVEGGSPREPMIDGRDGRWPPWEKKRDDRISRERHGGGEPTVWHREIMYSREDRTLTIRYNIFDRDTDKFTDDVHEVRYQHYRGLLTVNGTAVSTADGPVEVRVHKDGSVTSTPRLGTARVYELYPRP